ncbi:hypothetical protein Tco_0061983, partial [Tanacetum coccineum]
GEVIGAMGSGEGYGIAVECTRDSGFGHKPWGKLIGCNWARIGPSKSSQSLSIAHKWAVEID